MNIKRDDLTSNEVMQLLKDHLEEMNIHSPPESVHALDISGLQRPDVSFWTVWDGDTLLGSGALKRLTNDHAEIKSMRTAYAHRGRGVARTMLLYILDEALRKGFKRLSLETGSMDAFIPARLLYEGHGFKYCKPFADYSLDPNSVFMTLEL